MSPTTRIHFMDYLKVFLSCTVIIHHAGQPYGGSNGFWYVQDSGVDSDLGAFFGINAAFNMSLYFFLSAYFIPLAYKHKGNIGFFKDRLKRIGIPLLFGFLVIIPLIMFFYYNEYRGYPTLSFFEYYKNVYFGFGEQPLNWTGPTWPDLNFGHLWFIEHLLIYSLLYLLLMNLFKNIKLPKMAFIPNNKSIFIFAIIISFITYLVRTKYELDEWIGVLGFIQMEYAHFPQYLAFVILGITAAKSNWIHQISAKVGTFWLSFGILLIILNVIGLVPHSRGGWDGDSLIYAIYETFLCTALSIGLIELFQRKLNRKSKWVEILSKNTFCVYVIQTPVLMGIQYALISVPVSGYIKFGLASFLGIVLSHFISYFIIRKIPVISLLFSGNNPRRSEKFVARLNKKTV
ncbi:peptidoglycan/LPS O-acetylase OafA/YrhL [Ureibacillus xyleni]|uniref:Peptidoglycan/LPS O-acetylase OafA/YrhL n=1 Tax=Ureibacillus xyleni TaxID=614648 RepID=A0A285TKJ0_9BACL|nr:acyltransferase [Ureibacillus xyleni]SOC22739.1 peptidoglycan/LPS O-acetylase OafA/YrhL [Ureibacillus xyleni]